MNNVYAHFCVHCRRNSLVVRCDLPSSPSHTESSFHTWTMAPILHSTMGVSGPDHAAGPFFSSPATNTILSFASGGHSVRHLGNKHVAVADTVVASNLDILVITESWHRQSTDVALRHSVPPT